jgi:hypothetical protein
VSISFSYLQIKKFALIHQGRKSCDFINSGLEGQSALKKKLDRQINWFADFASLNLDNVDMGQLSKLRIELAQVLLTGFKEGVRSHLDEVDYANLLSEIERRYFESRDKIKSLQQTIFSNIAKLADGIERAAQKAEAKWIAYEDSETLTGVELISSKIHLDFEIKAQLLPARDYKQDAGEIKTRWKETWPSESSFLISTLPTGSPEDILLFRFSQLLEAVPVSAFRRCKSCGKVFFHISKREKTYCSNLCAAKAGNKKRREAIKKSAPNLYQEQLRKASQRAQKSYEKKVRRVHPKAKFRHRKPTKTI